MFQWILDLLKWKSRDQEAQTWIKQQRKDQKQRFVLEKGSIDLQRSCEEGEIGEYDGNHDKRTFLGVPNEIHLEILCRLDVPSLKSMMVVNRYFRELMHENEEMIVKACLRNECVGPHAILPWLYPICTPPKPFPHAMWIHGTKARILRVAKICGIFEAAKIEALYCIQKVCEGAYAIALNLQDHDLEEMNLDGLRNDLLSPYTTKQLQHMLPVTIRLSFKIAELMGDKFQGSWLPLSAYTRYNAYLVAYGPTLIADLDARPVEDRKKWIEKIWIDERLPRMHDELIQFLKTRGTGLMTDPGIEIQQFFREENTILDTRG
jgi:hypothetical protein